MSILDVAINGPFHIETEDVIAILGVSQNYVNRTRNLHEDHSPPREKPQPTNLKPSRPRTSHPGTRSAHALKRGPAHEASHSRTRSPRHFPARSRPSDHTPLGHSQAGALHQQFKVVSVWREMETLLHVCDQSFSLHGDRKGSGTQLTLRRNSQIVHSWIRENIGSKHFYTLYSCSIP